jgi:type I restriction enzyme R subunit
MIREFFPNAQLFGFTGTPIFEENAVYKKIDGTEKTLVWTSDVFENELHTYTITHAIDDKNVLQFHIDYYEEEPDINVQVDSTAFRRAVIKDILKKHDIATSTRKFNAILATSSIDNAIEYHQLFGQLQQQEAEQNPEFRPLNVACVFSPPVQILDKSNKNTKDVEQLQEDLPQEKYDNQAQPNEKKKALDEIIEAYNRQYGTNHNLANFDIYYQDVQKRIKDHQYPDKDYPHHNKIDITIVVDMLLTGFDSKYLNTLYVDKNLKYHGLIQAFSRTNRILNDTKPYGNIIDYRNQRDAVEDAVRTFSGKKDTDAKEIWIVDNAAIVIDNFNHAVKALNKFMHEQGLECTPDEVANIKGNAARATFINLFKDIQRYRTQLEQYTDLTAENKQQIEEIIPNNTLRSFKGMYLETAREMRAEYAKNNLDNEDLQAINELDFEFVLFASDIIDYDYIMRLLAQYTKTSKKQTMTKEQIISIIDSDSKFIDERDDIIAYINTLETTTQGLSEEQIKSGYTDFKANRAANALNKIVEKHGLNRAEVQKFVDNVLLRKIFDGELLSELFTVFGLDWKARAQKEMDFMQDLIPWLKKQVGDTEISGLSAYEQE